MKATIERSELLKATSRAQGVVERRSTIPILANLLIEAKDDRLALRATDLDLELIEHVPANVATAGAVTAPAHLLHEIVRKLPDGAQIEFAADPRSGQLELRAGRSHFTLATLPREDFPVMASSEYACSFTAEAPALRRLFDKSSFAVSTEETRYYLNGVYLHPAEEGGTPVLRAVATDGHRLARIDTALPDGAAEAPGVIVPRKTVGELRKLLDGDDGAVEVSVSETKIRFVVGELVLTSKVIDGVFPDYARVIPLANSRRLEVDARDFAAAVDRVATVSQERARAVKMTMENDRLLLAVTSPEAGSAEEELAVAYADERLEIGFNARYLLEIAAQIEQENAVFLFNGPGDPTLVRAGDDTTAIYVVMPMRV